MDCALPGKRGVGGPQCGFAPPRATLHITCESPGGRCIHVQDRPRPMWRAGYWTAVQYGGLGGCRVLVIILAHDMLFIRPSAISRRLSV